MGPPPSVTAATPRRQSCDRCHGQKLRCTRPDSRKSGACERCLRKNAKCVYSSSLPKGRPSLYRLVDFVPPQPTAAAAATTTTTEAAPRSPGSSATTASSSTRLETTPRGDTPESPSATSPFPGLPGTPVHPQTGPGCAQFGGDAGQVGIIGPQIDKDVHMCHQDGDFDLSPQAVDSLVNFWPSWWHDEQFGDSMMGIVPGPVPQPSNIDPALAAQASLSLGLDEVFTENGGGAVQSYAREDGNCQENQEDAEYRLGSMATRGSHVDGGGAPIISAVDDNGFERSIIHLSRLSTRLSQLLGCSRNFLAECLDPAARPFESRADSAAAAAAAAPRQVQLGIEAVFKSVNNWLVQGSSSSSSSSSGHHLSADAGGALQSPSDLLQHMFSASNQLLEILRDVRAGAARTSTAPSHTTTSDSSSTSCSTADDTGSSHGSSVVRQLSMVCVTLLLNMYVVILIALQRSADELNSRQQQQQQQKPHTHAAAAIAVDVHHHHGLAVENPQGGGGRATIHDAERVHLQLVTVVQLCAYFIRRQIQTLDVLMGAGEGPGGDGSGAPCSSLDAAGELQAEVKQRLGRIEDSLCIAS